MSETSTIRTVITTPVHEGTTPLLTATFREPDGTVITSPLTAATLRLFDQRTKEVINGRSALDLLPFIAAGVLTWWFEEEDTPIVNADAHVETHVARIDFTWNGGTRRGIHEIEHRVVNLA